MDVEQKGFKTETVEEFLPMFKIIVKVLRPLRPYPGLPGELRELVENLREIDDLRPDELHEVIMKKEVYETMFKYMMTVRIQNQLRG